MSTLVVKPSDYVKWGKLVKAWATGDAKYLDGQPVPPVPRSVGEVRQACEDIGLEIEIPVSITGLVVIQQSKNTMVLFLPPKDLIKDAERELERGGNYDVPLFYNEAYGNRPPNVAEGAKLSFHAGRIGDYSIAMCG